MQNASPTAQQRASINARANHAPLVIPDVSGARLRLPLRIVAAYAVGASLWIVLGDRLVSLLDQDLLFVSYMQTYKGLAFVCITSLLLFWMISRSTRHLQDINLANERLAERLHIQHRIDRSILAATSPQAIADAVLPAVMDLVPCQRVSLISFEEHQSVGLLVSVFGQADAEVPAGSTIPLAEGMFGNMDRLRAGLVNFVADASVSSDAVSTIRDLVATGLKSFAAVPLLVRGELIGTLNLWKDDVQTLTAEHIAIAQEIAAQMAIGLEHWRITLKLRSYSEDLERRIASRTQELRAANAELESFAYSVSHDLKAPLRAISGFAEIISRRHRKDLNDEAQRYFDNIVEASTQMGQLIADLLSYAQIGRHAIRSQRVDLPVLLLQLRDQFGGRMAAQGGSIELADDLPAIQGDATLVRQIFTNILENALTYRRPDQPARVEVTAVSDGARATIAVRDNGLGIAPEFHDKIFRMFQRLHGMDQYPGTGIGLAIVKKSAELQGGTVRVESQPGAGSTFYVQLPAATSRG